MQKNEPGYSSLVGCELRTMTKRTHSARGRNNSRNVVTCNISTVKKCPEVMPSKSQRHQAQKRWLSSNRVLPELLSCQAQPVSVHPGVK